MARFRPRFRPPARWLTAWSLLLALPFLAGGADRHSHAGGGEEVALRSGEVYSPQAIHPDQPQHFEAGGRAERPVCPICLFEVSSRGGHPRTLAGTAPDLSLDGLALSGTPRAASRHARPSCSRGPPTPSPLA